MKRPVIAVVLLALSCAGGNGAAVPDSAPVGGADAPAAAADGADAADPAGDAAPDARRVPGDSVAGRGDTADTPGDGGGDAAPDAGPTHDVAVDADPAGDSHSPDAGPTGCQELDSPPNLPLPEASGAALRIEGGARRVIVTSDSGNSGDAVSFDLDTHETAPLSLPLGTGASDDVEGLSFGPGGRLYGLTSSGQVREWTVSAAGTPALAAGPYPVAGAGSPLLCDPKGVNCGKNFEGLCLRSEPGPDGCIGYAASKADGHLHCLVGGGSEPLSAGSAAPIPVTEEEWLSGCDIVPGQPDRVVVSLNLYGGSELLLVRVQGPGKGDVVSLGVSGSVNAESVIADDIGRLFAFTDLQEFSDTSAVRVFQCW